MGKTGRKGFIHMRRNKMYRKNKRHHNTPYTANLNKWYNMHRVEIGKDMSYQFP